MSAQVSGQVRASQVITTWGPGALLDLPLDSGIVGGLDTWPGVDKLVEVIDARVSRKLNLVTGVTAPHLYAPPPDSNAPGQPKRGIGVWRFPEWVLVHEKPSEGKPVRSRRLVPRKALDEKGRFDGRPVVATRFVRACPRGHVEDLDWHAFAHHGDRSCKRQLWLDERGTGGDLGDLTVRCECKKSRGMSDAADIALKALGMCRGSRPWLGRYSAQDCDQPSRLLIRTAANAYFPQVMSALSLPNQLTGIQQAVAELWEYLQAVDTARELEVFKKMPKVAAGLAGLADDDVLAAIGERKHGDMTERPVKQVELDALLAAPEGYGDDVPIDEDFHARSLPEGVWRRSALSEGIASVIQLHRLREVLALFGFTRFEAVAPDVDGDYDSDVSRADLALEPSWFPAVENRGEGVFVLLAPERVKEWLRRGEVESRVEALGEGHQRWATSRKVERPFPGGPYVLLHTLSHLLIQSLAMRCGYPASSIRERVYVDYEAHRYGLLLYTASTDAEGTLGGLVQQARHIEEHLAAALHSGALCSNDPVCAQHSPGEGLEERWLHGAACHGCTLVAETSCEMRNDYLDRALVVPTLADPGAAYFPSVP